MKVLELTCEPILYGGQEAFIFNFIENLNNDDIKVDIATLYYCKNIKYRKIAKQKGANIFELGLDFKPGKSRRLIKRPLYVFLSNHQYDIVHIHSGSISALAYSAKMAKKAGIRNVIVHSHSTGIDNFKHKLIQTLFGPLFLRYVNVYCACSEEAGQMKFPQSQWNKIHVLNNGINLNRFEFNSDMRKKIRESLGVNEEAYLVGQIGRFTYEKNQEFIAQLSNKICKERKDIYFVFVGDGEQKEQIHSIIKNTEQVIFLNSCDDIWNYYNAFDILVLPSIYEGIPLVSIEAQANGLPVLASTGVSEAIEINKNVKRIELNNEIEWRKIITKRKLTRLESDDENLVKGSKWDINSLTTNMIDIYMDLLA